MKKPILSQLQSAFFQKYCGIILALSCADFVAPRLNSTRVRFTLHTVSSPPIKWLFLTNVKYLLLQIGVFCHLLLPARAVSCLRCGAACQEGEFCSVQTVALGVVPPAA